MGRAPGSRGAGSSGAILMGRGPARPAWCRDDGGDVVLTLHVQPGAARTEVGGVHGDAEVARLAIRLAAPPVDGKANAELIRFLAGAFGVPLRAVTLLRGGTSRRKTVRIARPTRRPDREWGRAQPVPRTPAGGSP
jgi:uncharacterized protein (TIGR00251 family)